MFLKMTSTLTKLEHIELIKFNVGKIELLKFTSV